MTRRRLILVLLAAFVLFLGLAWLVVGCASQSKLAATGATFTEAPEAPRTNVDTELVGTGNVSISPNLILSGGGSFAILLIFGIMAVKLRNYKRVLRKLQ